MASSQEERDQAMYYYRLECELVQITGKISDNMARHFAYLERLGISTDHNSDPDERWVEAVVMYSQQIKPELKAALDDWAAKTTEGQRVRAVIRAISNLLQRGRYTDDERRDWEKRLVQFRRLADEIEDD